MCDCKKGCQKPKALVGKPETCSPEQVKKCHGDTKEHPCAPPTETRPSSGGKS